MHGSSNGVIAARFENTPQLRASSQELRRSWGVPDDAPLIGFVGRLVRDKGLLDLVDAFEEVLKSQADAWLLLIGNYEQGDPVPDEYVQRIAQHPRIIHPGYVPQRDLAPYYNAITVFTFPSHREGFGNVALEAAAAELPVVGFRATGTVDAVQDGVTGTIVDLGDSRALAEAILRYLNDADLRRRHGLAGRQRALAEFRPEPIWRAMGAQFQELLCHRKHAIPNL
jgi:glycosyltransferase involved in cell wall biosynthesis